MQICYLLQGVYNQPPLTIHADVLIIGQNRSAIIDLQQTVSFRLSLCQSNFFEQIASELTTTEKSKNPRYHNREPQEPKVRVQLAMCMGVFTVTQSKPTLQRVPKKKILHQLQ